MSMKGYESLIAKTDPHEVNEERHLRMVITAAERSARDGAIEECAQVAELYAGAEGHQIAIAAAIRALKDKP